VVAPFGPAPGPPAIGLMFALGGSVECVLSPGAVLDFAAPLVPAIVPLFSKSCFSSAKIRCFCISFSFLRFSFSAADSEVQVPLPLPPCPLVRSSLFSVSSRLRRASYWDLRAASLILASSLLASTVESFVFVELSSESCSDFC